MLEDSPRPAQPQTYTVSLLHWNLTATHPCWQFLYESQFQLVTATFLGLCSTRRYRNVAVVKAAARPPHSKRGRCRDCCEEVDAALLLVGVLPMEKSRRGMVGRRISAAMLCPPGAPRCCVGRNGGAGDVAQGLEDPAASRAVQGHIVRHLKEIRHSAHTLLASEHPGLGQSTAAALAYKRRRIPTESLNQGSHRLVGPQHRQPLNSPIPRLLIRVMPMVHQGNERPLRLHATIAQHPQHPQRPGPGRRVSPDALNQVVGAFRTLRKVVPGQLDFQSRGTHVQVVGIQCRSEEAGELSL